MSKQMENTYHYSVTAKLTVIRYSFTLNLIDEFYNQILHITRRGTQLCIFDCVITIKNNIKKTILKSLMIIKLLTITVP